MVAQKDFSLVSVKPWAEGHLGPDLLSGEVAAWERGSDQQCCPLQAQVLQLPVRKPEHSHRAEVPACGDKGVIPPRLLST